MKEKIAIVFNQNKLIEYEYISNSNKQQLFKDVDTRNNEQLPCVYWMRLVPITDEKKLFVESVLLIATDITEKKQLERTLQQQKISKEKEKLTQRFLSNMSHELRTPLNAIIGFSDLLQRQMVGSLTEKQLNYSVEINEAGHHLLHLITQLLDLTRLEEGKALLQKESICLKQWVAKKMGIMEQEAIKKHITLRLTISPSLSFIYMDGLKFTQIMYNLITNAIKFTPEHGSVDISLKTGLTRND